jgi:hypothetical protein
MFIIAKRRGKTKMVRYDSKEVLTEFLRSRITDPSSSRTYTLTSDSFTASAAQTKFTLTPSSGSKLQYISSVTVDAATKDKWADYYIDTQNQDVNFASAMTGGEAVVVNYYEGTTNWIYPDKPREDLASTSYPRMNVLIVSSTGDRLGRYDADVEHNIHFQVDTWAKERQTVTIDSRTYEGDKLAFVLAEMVCNACQEYIDDIYPILYDYQPVGVRDLPFDREHQAFHGVAEFYLKQLNVGDSL